MTYTLPTPAQTRMVYPIVTSVDDPTLQFWLDRVVGRDVDQSWPDPLGADAQMAAAVHRYLKSQSGAGGTDGGDMAGVSEFRSASFQVRFSDAYAAQQAEGGWDSTEAGKDYLDCLRKKSVGVGVTSAGTIPCDNWPYNGYAGPLGYPARLFP